MKNRLQDVFQNTNKRSSRLLALRLLMALFLSGFFLLPLSLKATTALLQQPQQEIDIKGTVSDMLTGETLPGVNVMVKGTSRGTITDHQGAFSLKSPSPDAILVFSYMGYETLEEPVSGRTVVDIKLSPKIDMLNEVIVIAYGSTPRSNLTGSVVALSSDQLNDVFSPRLSTMIQGKAAGVYARSSSGRPGQAASINIRGKGSINTTNNPLWVIDGIAVGHDEPNLNPADVESITILKDASATALYGSRAANGVILVQTKTPEKGVSRLTFNASNGFTQLHRGNFSLMNAQELYEYHSLWNNSTWFKPELKNTNTDWIDIATQTGRAQEYNLGYTGGTDKVSTYLSGTYYNEEGALKGYDYQRYSAIANILIKATDRLSLKANLSGNLNQTENREHSTYSAYTYLPWDHPYKADGTPIEPGRDKEFEWIGRDQSNYLYNLQYNWGTGRSHNIRLNMGGDYEINRWFTFSSMNNISFGFGQNEYYNDPRSTSGQASNGSYTTGYSYGRARLTNQMLRFKHAFAGHSIQAFLAYEFSDSHSDSNSATGDGITAGLNVLNATSKASSVSGGKYQSARQSTLVNLQYVYNDKYMGTASFNREGSSSFGSDNQYGNFWSFSGGWNMHYEDFMQNLNWLNVLKLTASYGEVGNSPAGFPHLGYYELTGQYAGMPAARPYQLANPAITWEKSVNTNIALETRVFNRITATAELYARNNSGLLYHVPLSSLTGYTGIWENIGEIANKGLELTLSPEMIKSGNFQWDMSFNISFNRNEVIELFKNQPISSGNLRIEEGRDMDSYFMRKWYGVDPGNGDPLWERIIQNPDGTQTKVLTNSYSQATLQFTGQTMSPDYSGGIINQFRYKNWGLAANIGFVQGLSLYNSDRQLFDSDGSYPTFNHMNLAKGWSRWEKPGDMATHPKPVMGGNREANRPSSRYLEDASYIRLRNVTLSYALPQRYSQAVGFSKARLYLSGDNLFTITDWSGMDPESGGLYPVAQRYMMGIQIEF